MSIQHSRVCLSVITRVHTYSNSNIPQNGRTRTRIECARTRERTADESCEASARLPAVLEINALI